MKSRILESKNVGAIKNPASMQGREKLRDVLVRQPERTARYRSTINEEA